MSSSRLPLKIHAENPRLTRTTDRARIRLARLNCLSIIPSAPEFATTLNSQYIVGLGAVDDRMLILCDIENLMTAADMELVDDTAH